MFAASIVTLLLLQSPADDPPCRRAVSIQVRMSDDTARRVQAAIAAGRPLDATLAGDVYRSLDAALSSVGTPALPDRK